MCAASVPQRRGDAWFCRQAAQAAFVTVAAGFRPTLAGWRTTHTTGRKPAAGNPKPCGLAMFFKRVNGTWGFLSVGTAVPVVTRYDKTRAARTRSSLTYRLLLIGM